MKKKYLIITFVIAIVCIVSIGYAAFTSQLNITGTSTITSSWDIEITSVTVKSVVGNASKEIEPVVSGTSATFKTNLEWPGDSMTYEVTVTNNGSVDAKVGSIEMTDSSNPAIIFSTNGINQNDLLESKESQTFDVTVAYSDSVTTQPDNLSATLALKLNYVQNS